MLERITGKAALRCRGMAALAGSACALASTAAPGFAAAPDCAATTEGTLTQTRGGIFSDVIDDDRETSGIFVLSCLGSAGIFSYDLGLRVESEEDPELRIRDLKLGVDIGTDGFLILGYHPLNTDPGFTIQPIGLFGDSADYSTFIDRTFERESAPMARIEFFAGDVALASTITENRRHGLDSLQWVNSAAFSIGNTDAQVVLRYDDELGVGAGFAFSTIVGNNIQLHGSAFVQRGSARLYHADAISGDLQFRMADDSPIGRFRLDSDDLVPRVVIGGHYTFQNGDNFLFELIHDGEGMSRAEWDRYIDVIEFHKSAPVPIVARDGNLGFDLEVLGDANMQNYAFARYSFGQTLSNLSLSALVNLSDGSARLTADALFELSESAELYGNISLGRGCDTCEFGLLPERYSANLGLIYRF